MLKTLLEVGVVVGTVFLGGCVAEVSTIRYEPYPNDVIRVHPVPHSHYYGTNRLIAYAPKPIPRRLYYYNQLWYDEPSTVVIRSNVDRVRVPNSKLSTHFRTAPKRRNVGKDLKEMQRKKHEQHLKKRRTPDESTRLKPNSNSNRKVQDSDKRRRTLRTRKRPSSGDDKGKNRNRVRIHDGSNGKRRRSSGTHER